MQKFSDVLTYRVEVHREADGSYWAQVVEMPGCFASGGDIDELRESLAEAIGLYLSSENVTIDIHRLDLEVIQPPTDDVECYEARVPAPA